MANDAPGGAAPATRGTSGSTSPDAATSGRASNNDTFGAILKMLVNRSGGNFDSLIDRSSVTQWASTPAGFQFRVKAPGDIDRIAQALERSPAFGRVTQPFDRIVTSRGHREVADRAFREVGRNESLHVILFNDTKRPSIVHLDSHSIAVAKDRITGSVIYSDDLADHLAHLRHDLLHK